jgi:hypothetical protein
MDASPIQATPRELHPAAMEHMCVPLNDFWALPDIRALVDVGQYNSRCALDSFHVRCVERAMHLPMHAGIHWFVTRYSTRVEIFADNNSR